MTPAFRADRPQRARPNRIEKIVLNLVLTRRNNAAAGVFPIKLHSLCHLRRAESPTISVHNISSAFAFRYRRPFPKTLAMNPQYLFETRRTIRA